MVKSAFPVYAPIPICRQARRLHFNLTAVTEVQLMYDAAWSIVGRDDLGLLGSYYLMACFSIMMMLVRTLKQLDFQPRLSLITKTLSDGNLNPILRFCICYRGDSRVLFLK